MFLSHPVVGFRLKTGHHQIYNVFKVVATSLLKGLLTAASKLKFAFVVLRSFLSYMYIYDISNNTLFVNNSML